MEVVKTDTHKGASCKKIHTRKVEGGGTGSGTRLGTNLRHHRQCREADPGVGLIKGVFEFAFANSSLSALVFFCRLSLTVCLSCQLDGLLGCSVKQTKAFEF